jgi:dihydrofolate reductase
MQKISTSRTILNLVMTFDGYVAGIHDEMDWLNKIHKRPTGAAKWDFRTFISNVGAIIVGKRSYELGMAQGWFKNEAYGPSPIFVLCSNVPEKLSHNSDFRFITTGVKDAHRKASAAAGNKSIYLFGGANVFQQFLNVDLVDELRITIAPILIGKGVRLFDNLTERHIELEKISVMDHPNGMIETNYRIMK